MKRLYSFVIFFLFTIFVVARAEASSMCSSGYVAVADSGRIYYEIHGKGQPLLLLHGHTLDMRMWNPQVDEFAKHFQVITIDFRGYGRSSRMRDSLSVSHLDDVLAVMDSLNIQKAHVVGLSMGGFVAGDMLGMAPERMLSCVMCSGAMRTKHKSKNEPIDSVEMHEALQTLASIQKKGVEVWRSEWIEKLIKGGGSNAETIRKALTEQIMEWDTWQLTHVEPHLYYGHEAFESLQIKRPLVPTLYLSGEMEHKSRMKMLDFLPCSKQIEIPDCGHMSNMERPDVFNKVVLDFLMNYAVDVNKRR